MATFLCATLTDGVAQSDFLFLQHSRELGNGVWIVASRSAGVSQDLLPSPPGASRAELMTSGWVIRPLRDQPGMCDIVYVVQADVGALPETGAQLLHLCAAFFAHARVAQCSTWRPNSSPC